MYLKAAHHQSDSVAEPVLGEHRLRQLDGGCAVVGARQAPVAALCQRHQQNRVAGAQVANREALFLHRHREQSTWELDPQREQPATK